MFEDSLVESTQRIRTRSKWYAVASFALEALALAILILIPYIYPAALPPHALASLLIAPPPPPAPPSVPHITPARAHAPVQVVALNELAAPTIIPRRIAQGNIASLPPPMNTDLSGVHGSNIISRLALPPSLPPRARPSGPVRVSSGVAEGRLLAPIRPIYPAIARINHIQGTVVIEAVISKQGLVEQAHVVGGQPMLAEAAMEAVRRARYQPYRLNGEPVEVETTIHIEFILGN